MIVVAGVVDTVRSVRLEAVGVAVYGHSFEQKKDNPELTGFVGMMEVRMYVSSTCQDCGTSVWALALVYQVEMLAQGGS